MTRVKRTFSPEERLSLIQEASREGFAQTCRKYNLAPSLLNRWKKKYLEQGLGGLKPSRVAVDPKVKELEQENERLKKIIARQALELEVKEELLKNSYPNQTKVAIMQAYIGKASTTDLMKWLGIPSSSYYYKPTEGKPGRKPSTHTLFKNELVENQQVVAEIKGIILGPYNAYGYQNVTAELREMGYWIDDKKVYRIMDEEKLLLGKVIRTKGKREWVQYRKVEASRPMEYLCLDIKYVWVHGESRWYYQLSIMDIYSRKIIHWIFQSSVRKKDVIDMFRYLHLKYDLKGVIIRNDNGSQFLANEVRRTLQEMEARQEFTHVATPEENAYIESFHSIQQRELYCRYQFLSYYEAKKHIEDYMHWYNNKRKHKNLGRITPQQKWDQGMALSTLMQSTFAADDGLSRPVDTAVSKPTNQPLGMSLDKPAADAYLCITVDQSHGQHY